MTKKESKETNRDYKEEEENSLKTFGIAMLIVEIVMIILFWIFVRVNLTSAS